MNNSKYIFILFIFFYSLGISQVDSNSVDEGKGDIIKGGNTISGNIFIGDNLLFQGQIYLVSKSKSKSISATSFNSDVSEGMFMFDNVDINNFSLYVIPAQDYDFFYFPKYLPTYLGDVCSWEDAVINDTKMSNTSVDIHLKKYLEPFYGHGEISGRITYDRNVYQENFIPIAIFLLNNRNEPMDFRIADKIDGSFKFANLPEGKYYIHPEIPGFNTEDTEVVVKEKHINNRVDFRINNNSIEQDITDDKPIKPIVIKGGLRLHIDDENISPIVCELSDISGRLILKDKFDSNEIFMNTSNITTGIYLFRARTFTNSIVKTTKVYINNK